MQTVVELTQAQAQAYKCEKRFLALIAGTGGGKTYFGPIWLSREIQKYPQDPFFVIAPTVKMLQRAAIPALINHYKGTYFEGEFKESKGQYILPTGGVIYFGSSDNPDSLEGPHVRAIWMDEASLMARLAWVIAQARAGKNLGKILITTTPRTFNWLYHNFYKRYLDGDKDYEVIQFRSIDNPHYPQEEFERMRKTLDSRIFEMRYCGQFRKMTGLVYPDFDGGNIVDTVNADFIKVVAGVDFGFNNPSVIVVLGLDKDGIWYLLDEWYERGKLLEDILTQVQIMQAQYGISVFNCDPSQPAYIETFNQNGLAAIGANNSISFGIQIVASSIKQKLLKIKRDCKNTIEEMSTYHYPEEAQKDVPVKEDDHCMDALRYALIGSGEQEEIEEEEIITGDDLGFERVNIGVEYD